MADGDSDALAGAADVMDHLASGANRDEPPADARSNNSSVTPLHITNRETNARLNRALCAVRVGLVKRADSAGSATWARLTFKRPDASLYGPSRRSLTTGRHWTTTLIPAGVVDA
jgi:hypothetical protein